MGASFVFIIVRQHDQSYRGNIDIVKEPYSTHDLKYLMWSIFLPSITMLSPTWTPVPTIVKELSVSS